MAVTLYNIVRFRRLGPDNAPSPPLDIYVVLHFQRWDETRINSSPSACINLRDHGCVCMGLWLGSLFDLRGE